MIFRNLPFEALFIFLFGMNSRHSHAKLYGLFVCGTVSFPNQ